MKTKTIPKEVRKELGLSPKARILRPEEMHRARPESLEPKNIKVRISIWVDLDILDFFKAQAETGGDKYQTRINAALRRVMENEQPDTPESVEAKLRQARQLIDSAMRKIS
jgi:uncharacterized protein (DUF4415 family)